MAEQWRIRRGTNTENNAFTGALGEVTMDTDRNEVRIHDGSTVGGTIIGRNYKTNCITEIPQDIKLELNNGTLTLKADSKVYVPNGAGVFDEVTIASDLSYSYSYGAYTLGLYYNPTTDNLEAYAKNAEVSGTTPTNTCTFYNTNTNNVSRINNGVVDVPKLSFPIATITTNASQITSIDQVFNGFGYIGSTRFALPNIKWLSPDSRNTDGTLKSIQRTNTNVLVETLSGGTVNDIVMILGTGSIWTSGKYIESETEPSGSYIVWYKPSENILRDKAEGNWNINNNVVVYGYFDTVSSQIVNFRTKQPFQALDYNNTDLVVDFQRPTAQNNYTWYRKYKSGWVEQGGYQDGSVSHTSDPIVFPIEMSDTKYSLIVQSETTEKYSCIQSKTKTGFCVKDRVHADIWYDSNFKGTWQVSGMVG